MTHSDVAHVTGAITMYNCCRHVFASVFLIAITTVTAFAQNPIITNQFTADPSARVFGDIIYLYASHDILATEGRGRPGWFCMEDYHVFSSANLVDWTDHGVIVSQETVPWVNAKAYSLWAPDAINRNGKYYFYFPAAARDTSLGRGFSIGVAISSSPAGPFAPEPQPIRNARGIDPNVFIDKDGQAYLYWAARNMYVAKLKDNMVELDGEPQVIRDLPEQGLKEGPFMFERNGIYYMTYPHVQDKIERLEYAIGDNPLGPFTIAGVIMDESPTGCWTNHQSILEFNNQWYLFYHHNDLSPQFDKNRSVRVDSLFFNNDGTIRKVVPTLRAVGVTDARKNIQIDRYSVKSDRGSSTDFLDTLSRFGGWKAILDTADAWIQYNSVDFGTKKLKTVHVWTSSASDGTLELRRGNSDGPVVAWVKIPGGSGWRDIEAPVSGFQPGIHNLIVQLKGVGKVEVDWVRFE
jgi:hypothetical protein